MDNRRMIIAITISALLLFGWQFFAEEMGWTPKRAQQPATQAQSEPAGDAAARSGQAQEGLSAGGPQGAAPQITGAFAAGREIVVDTPLYTATFNSVGGLLTSFVLKNYTVSSEFNLDLPKVNVQMISPEAKLHAPMGVLINNQHTWRNAEWAFELGDGNEDGRLVLGDGQKNTITFVGQLGALTLRRVITFDAASYVLGERLELSSATFQTVGLGHSISTGNLAGPDDYMKVTRVARLQNGSFDEVDDTSDLANGMTFGTGVAWGGNMSNYFIAAMMPANNTFRMDARYQDGVYTVAFKHDTLEILPDFPVRNEISYYFGPKDLDALALAPNNLAASVDYGWFGWIASPLMAMLKFFYSYVGNWGGAIILLTVLVKLVLWPLSYKSYKSMQGMKVIQPHMAKIREKYKGDKQRMNQEMMQLYKTYKINPMGGCLPILVQLPVFFGLYKALLNAFELRQASFIPHLPGTDIVWLADLSLKDPLYITPLIMGATMFLQQKLTPAPGDPTQAKIMLFMPVVFTFMFLSFPSGLVLYWLVNNVISIGQQHWQLRRTPKTA